MTKTLRHSDDKQKYNLNGRKQERCLPLCIIFYLFVEWEYTTKNINLNAMFSYYSLKDRASLATVLESQESFGLNTNYD